MSYIVPRDKPKRCTRPKCRFMDMDTLDCRLQGKSWESFEEQYEHCPLIEVSPHGRLIDADKLIDGCEKLMRMLDPEGKEYLRVFAIKSYLMWAAEYAVIEAEGDET